jgi:glycosyltransferase involved in cell wall biosynthesis
VDCSSDDSVERFADAAANLILVREQKRFTPGIERNIGADRAGEPCMVFIDADASNARVSAER